MLLPSITLPAQVQLGLHLMLQYWWTYVPIMLATALYAEWFGLKQAQYVKGLQWVLIEIIPPPDVQKSPKIAENLFAGLHATYGGGVNWKSQFFTGKIPDWWSWEIVSNGGETHFYVRCPKAQQNVLEALVFAQYPDAEIRPVVDDYVTLLPEQLPLDQYDVSGTEFEFTKDQAFPLKTYEEFEEEGGKDEFRRSDPLSPLLEIMSALRPGEYLWLQLLLRPTGGDWVKENQKVIDKILGKEEKKAEPGLVEGVLKLPLYFLDTAFETVATAGTEPKKEEKKEEKKAKEVGQLTPQEKLTLTKVQEKMNKLAFKTGYRLMYVARKEAFNGSRTASVVGMFKQLFSGDWNSFKPAKGTKDKGRFPWMFPSDKGFGADAGTARKKQDMYKEYRNRSFPEKMVILNTQELATLWHLPGLNVRAPLMPRVQAKKGQPPSILPTR